MMSNWLTDKQLFFLFCITVLNSLLWSDTVDSLIQKQIEKQMKYRLSTPERVRLKLTLEYYLVAILYLILGTDTIFLLPFIMMYLHELWRLINDK